jgi:4-amino-4-deoxy-L-arabinose transferase-like glycosyltransferase
LSDGLWLVALAVYILAGVTTVPFHGDEAMQITMSRDYFTLFIDRQPQALQVAPPYAVDSPALLRLINGSINLYTMGFSLQVAGYTEQNLPPLWQWPLSYDDNVTRGSRPEQAMLNVSRLSSALFLALSAVVLFGIGWQIRGRLVANLASGLYALNPVILLNGRRAMMEGSVLCFGLLAILLAILICKGRSSWRWWLALGIASGLTLASKHSGIIFVAAAFGWLVITQLQILFAPQRHRAIKVLSILIKLVSSLVIMAAVFIALSPAQWNNPLDRFGDLINERAKLLESQVKAEPTAPTSMGERISGILTQPYIQPPVYYEVGFWAGAAPVQTEIAHYDASVWSGLHAGTVIGGLLTLLALVGLIALLSRWRTWEIGLLVWLGVVVASLLVNPLPWQRYYLALYPIAALLTAVGIATLLRFISTKSIQRPPKSS